MGSILHQCSQTVLLLTSEGSGLSPVSIVFMWKETLEHCVLLLLRMRTKFQPVTELLTHTLGDLLS